jgi:hypothetical protein
MKKWSKRRKIIVGLFFLVVVSQAIRPKKNAGIPSGPTDITTKVAVPESVMVVLKQSCYDCHSDYSAYTWYDEITPVSWWVANHIEEGKRELNFTHFGEYTAKKMDHKMEEIAETVEKEQMPLPSYLWTHGEAKLTQKQKQVLIDWANNSRKALMP